MSNAQYDLVRMTTPTTGTGPVTLGSTVPGFNSLSAASVPSGARVSYALSDGGNSEVGKGFYIAGAVTRSTILASTNGGAAINLSGNAQIALSPAAEDIPVQTDYATVAAAQNDYVNVNATFLRTAGYSTPGDGGGALYIHASASTPGGFQSADGQWWKLGVTRATPEMFGAPANGSGDDGPAWALAMASSISVIELSPKTYTLTSAGITMSTAKRIVGAGRGQTTINSSAPGNAITVNANLTGWEITDFTLNFTGGVPTSAQNGIYVVDHCEEAQIEKTWVNGFYHNYRLAATGYSEIRQFISNNALSDGVLITNSDGVDAGLQWNVDDFLIQQSGGYALNYVSTMAPGANLGPISKPWTFANTLGALNFSGTSSAPINGVRIGGPGSSSSEGKHAYQFNTFGNTTISVFGIFTEQSGLDPTGPSLGTAASNQGCGFFGTQNNQMISLVACQAEQHSWSGIELAANRGLVLGNTVRLNGQAGLSGELTGILIDTGFSSNMTVVGNVTKGQDFGIYTSSDNHVIVANDCSENSSGAIGATGNLTISQVIANKGGNGPSPSTGAAIEVTTINLNGLVAVNPHVVGQAWNSSGAVDISAG